MSLKRGQRVRFNDEVNTEGVVDYVANGIAWIDLPQNEPRIKFGFCFAGDVPDMEVVSG